ncbi:MAG TPA: carboxypeptidase regulatory-like domain-containing protein [Candidatus Acidoferrum sp.]
MKLNLRGVLISFLYVLLGAIHVFAQQNFGSINGTVTDSSSASVPDAKVQARNAGTNLEQTAITRNDGSYSIVDLPVGTYVVTVTKDGFKTEEFTEILVRGGTTTTVNARLEPGHVTSTVTVTGTPLLNETDTTIGYTLDSELIQKVPLGTGSFTQLAILSPGVSADMLGGSGANAGLGNQSIWANGQRDTSNSFEFNGVNANNIFNGKSSSQVGANRFVLSTGENFLPSNGGGGDIQTNMSVYNAIGQGLPSAPPETIAELRVNTAMYDASQGANSGAHIAQLTKSGTNEYHGQVYEYFQSNKMNAAPFFRNADPTIPASDKVPALHYNRFGATLGGPIIRDKMFFFGSYQGTRVTDQTYGTSLVPVPPDLTDDRSPQGIANTVNTDFNSGCGPGQNPPFPCLQTNQIDPVALALLQAKTPQGTYLIPSAQTTSTSLGHNATVQGPPGTFTADQVNGNVDYNFSQKDRFAAKYFYQRTPGTSEFSASQVFGFPQKMDAGSQALSLTNTTILTPNFTWEQRFGFIREKAFVTTSQPFGPTNIAGSGQSINLFGQKTFPGITISNSDGSFDSLAIGTAGSPFSNAGVFQNQFEAATSVNWIHGRHTIAAGFNWDYTQLNIINRNSDVAGLTFGNFADFVVGQLRNGIGNTVIFTGSSNRYYRANQVGTFIQDNFRLRPNLTINLGLRWDWDGPLSEKNGLMSNFYDKNFSYDLNTDSFSNIGLVIAGNNKTLGTHGVSNSTMLARQWGFGPRIGVVWSPSRLKNVVVRAGFGLYFDRGEFYSEFSPSAGNGFNGPFGVTLEAPFVIPTTNSCTNAYDPVGGTSCFAQPFGSTPPPPPPNNLSSVQALVQNRAGLVSGNSGLLFGGYDPNNKLPYSENWQLDFQWQPISTVAITVGYVGNHGVHLVLPIAFNQPLIATSSNPVNGETSSYGYQVPALSGSTEPYNTSTGGNTDLRSPYIGYSPNSVFYKAEGVSNYNALQLNVQKRLSHGLIVTGSYTWSHTLDEQSGLGLFFTGNNPLQPHSAYASSDFDRTHILSVSYEYQFPNIPNANGFTEKIGNGWGIGGVIIAQSGQPYSIYDFTGGVASVYYGTNNFIGNPIVPLLPGQTPASAQKIPPCTANCPTGPVVVNPAAFGVPLITPGQMGVPVGDPFETSYGTTGRNIFRSPFQTRFDFSTFKDTKISERFALRFDAQFFNIFNHPVFDAPNNNVAFNPSFCNPPDMTTTFSCGSSPGYLIPPSGHGGNIQHTIGSPRFVQLALHLRF